MLEFLELAKVCAPDVHATTLVAVVSHESGFDPLIINVNKRKGKPGRQIRSKTWDQAVEQARTLLASGESFDAGYGQINNKNWEWLGITPENVFDPCTNLHAAQSVLIDCYQRADKKHDGPAALYAALSCYNTGNFTFGFENGYVGKVLAGAGVKVPALPGTTLDTKVLKKTPKPAATATKPTKPVGNGAFGQRKQDAFAQPRADAFAQTRGDAFAQPFSPRSPVGSIIYHNRAHP